MDEEDGKARLGGVGTVPVAEVRSAGDVAGEDGGGARWEDGEGGAEVGAVQEEAVVAEVGGCEGVYEHDNLGRLVDCPRL